MSKIYRLFLLVWIFAASWSVCGWWQSTQGAVINLPVSVWNWLADDVYGVTNAEQGADLEALVGMIGALIFVTISTCLAEGLVRWILWRRRCWQYTQQHTPQIGFKTVVVQWACSCAQTVYLLLIGIWSEVTTFNVLASLEASNRLPEPLISSDLRALLLVIISFVFVFASSWLVLHQAGKALGKLRHHA